MKASQLTRREMLKILAASAAGAAGTWVSGCAPQPTPAAAPASPVAALFDYKRFKGQSIFVSLSKNPVADLIAANIAEFKELTGITAEVEVIPEQQQRPGEHADPQREQTADDQHGHGNAGLHDDRRERVRFSVPR